jgi:hypothetical protein
MRILLVLSLLEMLFVVGQGSLKKKAVMGGIEAVVRFG